VITFIKKSALGSQAKKPEKKPAPKVSSDLEDAGLGRPVQLAAKSSLLQSPTKKEKEDPLPLPLPKPEHLLVGSLVEIEQPSHGAWYPVWQPGDTGIINCRHAFVGCLVHEKQHEETFYSITLLRPRSKDKEATIKWKYLKLLELPTHESVAKMKSIGGEA